MGAERPLRGEGNAALIRECRAIAADARRILFLTRARIVRALPEVEGERRFLAELAERAEALARELSARGAPRSRPPQRPGRRRASRGRGGAP